MKNKLVQLSPHILTGIIVASGHLIVVLLRLPRHLSGPSGDYYAASDLVVWYLGWAAFQVLIVFLVAGYIGRFLWKFNWFKYVVLILALLHIGAVSEGILLAMIPLIYTMLILWGCDGRTYYWFRGAIFGLVMSSLPFYTYYLRLTVKEYRGDMEGLAQALIFFPVVGVGVVIGLCVGLVYGIIKRKTAVPSTNSPSVSEGFSQNNL